MVFIIDRIEGGGAEKIIIRLALLYSTMSNQPVTIICNFESSSKLLNSIKGSKVSVRWPEISERRSVFGKLKSLFLFLKFAMREIRQDESKVVLSFLERSNIVNIIASKLLGRKAVISVRNNLNSQYSNRGRVERFVAVLGIKMIYPLAWRVVSLSKAVRCMLIRDFSLNPSKVITINNPYPLNKFGDLAKLPPVNQGLAEFLDRKGSTLIILGRLDVQKGHWHLLRLMPTLKELYPDLKLVILGDGPFENQFRRFISANGLEDCCFLSSGEENPYGALARSDIFVFPSLWEGFGNALVEALAVGTPVIAADCPHGPREILGINENDKVKGYKVFPSGILVEALSSNFTLDLPGQEELDANPLFLALRKLLDSPCTAKQLRAMGPESVARLDENKIMYAWDRIFKGNE